MKPEKAKVYKTKDLEMFNILAYNRPINENRVEKIKESIEKYGFLLPLLVNENMYVADGQHRLEGAKRAGVGVTYIVYDIEDDKLPILISKVNSVAKTWTLEDYYNMHVIRRVPDYLYLENLRQKHDINFNFFSKFIKYICTRDAFMEGILEITETQKDRLDKKLTFFNDIRNFSNTFNSFTHSSFYPAIIKCIQNINYKHARMMVSLEKYGGSLLGCSTSIDFVLQLETIYNKGYRGSNKLIFSKSIH